MRNLGFLAWVSIAVSRSATEAELRAATKTSCDLVMWRRIFIDLQLPLSRSDLPLGTDSSGAEQNANHRVVSRRMRHVDASHFLVREFVRDGLISTFHIPTDFNPIDIGTKILGATKFLLFSRFVTNV